MTRYGFWWNYSGITDPEVQQEKKLEENTEGWTLALTLRLIEMPINHSSSFFGSRGEVQLAPVWIQCWAVAGFVHKTLLKQFCRREQPCQPPEPVKSFQIGLRQLVTGWECQFMELTDSSWGPTQIAKSSANQPVAYMTLTRCIYQLFVLPRPYKSQRI